jgi:glycosyltransferase involved in cell wall biosynthesis
VPGAQLVLPGAPTAYEDALRSRASELGIADAVAFPGYVSDADLEGLYAIADCFAFPSSNEGFGLPLLEAMARDVPVVCADASALPEVVGDAALLVDPDSTTALARAIGDVLTDPELRTRLVAAGRERLPLFTWDRCASETLETLNRAVAQRARCH